MFEAILFYWYAILCGVVLIIVLSGDQLVSTIHNRYHIHLNNQPYNLCRICNSEIPTYWSVCGKCHTGTHFE